MVTQFDFTSFSSRPFLVLGHYVLLFYTGGVLVEIITAWTMEVPHCLNILRAKFSRVSKFLFKQIFFDLIFKVVYLDISIITLTVILQPASYYSSIFVIFM